MRIVVTDQMRAGIRDAVEDLTIAGERVSNPLASPTDSHGCYAINLRTGRALIAEHYGLSLETTCSIGAYIRYSMTRALKGILPNADDETVSTLIFCSRRLRLIDDTLERQTALKTLYDFFATRPGAADLSITTFENILTSYEVELRRKPGGLPEPDQQLRSHLFREPPRGLTALLQPALPEVITAASSQQDATDRHLASRFFENPVKRTWNDRCVDRLTQIHDAHERRTAIVAGLFGEQVELSEPIRLINAGYLPQNIFAIERKPSDRAAFEGRCRELGINPVVASLTKFLKTHPTPISVLFGDFLGGVSLEACESLRYLSRSPKCVVILNFQQGRESEAAQENFAVMLAERKTVADQMVARCKALNSAGATYDDLENLEEDLIRRFESSVASHSIQEHRPEFISMVTGVVADFSIHQRQKNLYLPELLTLVKKFSEMVRSVDGPKAGIDDPHSQLVVALTMFQRQLFESVIFLQQGMEFWNCSAELIRSAGLAILDGLLPALLMQGGKTFEQSWTYQSESGSGGRRYYSALGVVETPVEDYQKSAAVVRFMTQAFMGRLEQDQRIQARFAPDEMPTAGFRIVNRNSELVSQWWQATRLQYFLEDVVLAEIPVRDFEKATARLAGAVTRLRTSRREVPTEELTPATLEWDELKRLLGE